MIFMRKNRFLMLKNILCISLSMLLCVHGCMYAAAEEMANSYEEKCRFVAELFGFEESMAYPYLPMHIDPVCYRGYLSITGGMKDEAYYAAYGGWSAQNVESYREYLEFWGYECADQPCELPGVKAWTLSNPSPEAGCDGLLNEIRLYHVADREILVITYPYLDAFLYDEWVYTTFSYPYWKAYEKESIPFVLQLSDQKQVTVEETCFGEELLVHTKNTLILGPYDLEMLADGFADIEQVDLERGIWHMSAAQSRNSEQRMNFPCIRLVFEDEVDKAFLDTLCAALADSEYQYADCASPAMFCASEKDGILSIVDIDTKVSSVWVVFPPGFNDPLEPRRLYLRMRDPQEPWIGDLRQWTYADFFLAMSQRINSQKRCCRHVQILLFPKFESPMLHQQKTLDPNGSSVFLCFCGIDKPST